MAKMKKDSLTGDLLDWQPSKVTEEYAERDVRAHNASAKYAKAIALTLNDCELNRDEIAMKMSVYLGEDFGKNMLDAYAAETRPSHMITLSRLEALIHVTSDLRLLSLIADKFKQIVVPAVYSHLIKSHQINDKITEMQAAEKEFSRKFKVIAAKEGFAI